MNVRVLTITAHPKPTILARAQVEIQFDDGESLTIDDLRVLRNRSNQLWVAPPSYSVPINGGRNFDYVPTVNFSVRLRRTIEDAVLAAFEQWEREQRARGAR